MKPLHRIVQLQIPMILDHPHPISNGISMTKHIRSHMLNTPITKQILMQSLQVIRIMNLIILFNILQILIMISHQKNFIIHRMKNSKESHLLKPGNFLSIIRSINKSSQRTLITYTNLTKRVDRTSNSCINLSNFFLNELFQCRDQRKLFRYKSILLPCHEKQQKMILIKSNMNIQIV